MRSLNLTGLFASYALSALLQLGDVATAQAGTVQSEVGWQVPQAPQGRLLPWRLSTLRENQLLATKRQAALHAVGRHPADYHPERQTVVFIHGLDADPKEIQPLLDRFRGESVQPYVLAYDDFFERTSENGVQLARELLKLASTLRGAGRNVTLVGHSMGGIVARVALNTLAQQGAQQAFETLRLFAVDTPWHGYVGPCDRGLAGALMTISRLFMPDGLEDMRACSAMFVGQGGEGVRVGNGGLYSVPLPDNFEVHLLFAQEPGVVLRLGEGPLAALPGKLVQYYSQEVPVRGDTRMMNYWRALVTSAQYFGFQDEMRRAADAGVLDEPLALTLLRKHFPSFEGNHDSVLLPNGAGPRATDYLAAQIRPPPSLSPNRAPTLAPHLATGVQIAFRQ